MLPVPNQKLTVAVAVSMLLVACTVTPEDGQFTCSENAACPSGWICDVNGDGRCHKRAGNYAHFDSGSAPFDDTGSTGDTAAPSEDSDNAVDTSEKSSDSDTSFAVDTSNDSDLSSDSDPLSFDSESDILNDSDSAIENSCSNPVVISATDATVSGWWSDYSNSFTPDAADGCGQGGNDLWILLTIDGNSHVQIKEVTGANVTIRRVVDCGATSCVDYVEKPEKLTMTNNASAAQDYYIVVSEAASNTVDAFLFEFND